LDPPRQLRDGDSGSEARIVPVSPSIRRILTSAAGVKAVIPSPVSRNPRPKVWETGGRKHKRHPNRRLRPRQAPHVHQHAHGFIYRRDRIAFVDLVGTYGSTPARLTVLLTGIGRPPETKPKIFTYIFIIQRDTCGLQCETVYFLLESDALLYAGESELTPGRPVTVSSPQRPP
jgi:hypothetical protein